MTTQSFMVGTINDGLRKDVKPAFINEDAWEVLINAFQFRGRLLRKLGYSTLGRLANNTPVMGLKTRELFGLNLQQLIAFDTTQAYAFDGTLLTFTAINSLITPINPFLWSGTDYQFFNVTNYAGAFWVTNGKSGLHGATITSAVAGVGITTITTAAPHGFTTGQTVTIINIISTATPPVDDLNGNTYVITVTGANTFTIPFATTSTYSSGGIALNPSVSVVGQDGIRFYGNLTGGNDQWANYNPPIDPNNALAGCLLIFPYRGYLVFLNTTEGNETITYNYGNRARWTQIGTPYYSQPVPTTPSPQTVDPEAVRDDLFGRGGAADAPTQEVIIGAAFIRDVLIVYFERSTWRLRFVNNAQNPFVWERINIELGSSCTQSAIAFDKGLIAIGNRGIVISDGNDVQRFDEKIPDDIFQIRASEHGFERVYGIRTFRTRLCYFTYPNSDNVTGIYPDQVLVFNYETKNWSYFDDCFTCFGYYYPSTSQLGDRWQDLTEPWPFYDNKTCEVGVSHTGLETVIAGNQQGFVFVLEEQTNQNSPSLYISAIAGNVLSSPNNNLPDGTWIKLTGILGTTGSDGVSLNGRNFKIANPGNDPDDFTLTEFESIQGPQAIGASYSYTINFFPILPGSVQINIGTLVFTDPALDGILTSNVANTVGTINYASGTLSLTFNPVLGALTDVFIRVVSIDPEQILVPVSLTGAYGGSGLITKISNIDIQSKIFNFFKSDERSRLSKIDFYTDITDNGQFTVNILADSSDVPVNVPLSDNPQSNVVKTSQSPYQVGVGQQAIYRLYCDVIAQTVQMQITLSDRQMAVDAINNQNIELLAMIFSLRKGGRLV